MRILIVWLSIVGAVLLGVVGYFTLGPGHGERFPVWTVTDGDPRQGRRVIVMHGCHACHVIAGIREATGRVGPKLEEIDSQIYIGGVLPNSPDNMVRWILDPRSFSPETAMPDLDVSAQDARNIAAYLFRNP